MNMKVFGRLVIGAVLIIVFGAAAPAESKLNVLFLAVDDLRPQIGNADISLYSTELMETPHLDKLAEDGAMFEYAYCNIPVCGASRLSIMTGVRPFKTPGVNYGRFWSYHDRLDAESPSGAPAGTNHPLDGEGNPALTLPGIFKRSGYLTQSIGKIYHHRGDDVDSWTQGVTRIKDFKNYNIETEENAYEIGIGLPDTAYSGGKNRNLGIQALRTLAGKEKPFFLALGFTKPHLPFNAPEKYWNMYDRSDIKLPENPTAPLNAPAASLHNWGELRGYKNVLYKDAEQKVLADDYARTLIHGYYACVSYTDAMIGGVLAELDSLGIRDSTIVVLWGDHGWNLGEHNLWCKHCLYETSLRVPLFVDTPGKPGNIRIGSLTEYVDVYPTLCELAGIALPDHLEGTSLVPLLENPNTPWKGAVFSNWQKGKSVRTGRYRYSEYYNVNDGFRARMLYDHQTDPMETVNIAGLPGNQALVETLSKLLDDGWRRAALEDNRTPIAFNVLPDGVIEDVTTAAPPLHSFEAKIHLLAEGRKINHHSVIAAGGTSLTFRVQAFHGAVPSGDIQNNTGQFQVLDLSLADLNGKGKRIYAARTAGNDEFVWKHPISGAYVYQVRYLTCEGRERIRTGMVSIVN